MENHLFLYIIMYSGFSRKTLKIKGGGGKKVKKFFCFFIFFCIHLWCRMVIMKRKDL